VRGAILRADCSSGLDFLKLWQSAEVVTVELLAALDALIWLRTGDRAAGLLSCTQSTVSRASRRCLEVFRLEMEKLDGEWELRGDQTLLNLQRRVHQTLRWREGSGLRVEAQHWCSHWLRAASSTPWCGGNGNYFEYQRPLTLLDHGVIDAWICSGPDYPRHSDLQAIWFVTMPIHLVVKPGHPLLERGSDLCFEDLADYPVLPLPDGAFPRFQQVLQDLGLWACAERDARLRQAPWFGQVPLEDLIISFETPLRRAAGVTEVGCPLPLRLPVQVGEVVMVKPEFRQSPHLLTLLQALCERAERLAVGQPEVQVHSPDTLVAA
jgi:hypothetical protein